MDALLPSLLIPLGIAGFIGFWLLIVKLINAAGWGRLEPDYAAGPDYQPPGGYLGLRRVRLGGATYKGGVRAQATPQGLALRLVWPFSIGRQPLLIPWAAIGPVRTEQHWFSRSYHARIHTRAGEEVAFMFIDRSLFDALQPWQRLQPVGRGWEPAS